MRITIVDDDLHAVSMTATDDRGEQRLDIRSNEMAGVKYEPIKLPSELEATIRRYVGSYQLRFAAIDMALDKAGKWVFFELNPNGQWAWLDQSGASDIAGSFIKTFQQ
jgi:glutathione synthase/RimK-type ligase-like ATP-grasp enzyme